MKVFVSIPKNTEVFDTFVSETVRKYMEERMEVKYSPYEGMVSPEQFAQQVADCDAVITGWGHPCITLDMVKNSNIKLIVHTGGSVGSLVTPDIYENGIKVISGNLMYAESVAEGVIAYMLMTLRKIPDYVYRIKNGGWHEKGDYSKGLLDRSVGIIGVGTISKFLINKLQVFNVKLKLYSSYPIDKEILDIENVEQVTLEEALQCDVVSLHSAMNERTRGMIGTEEFKLIKDGALFVNTARGRIVDENAMIEELKKNRFDAVLDVYYDEPLGADNPLRTLENVYCMPHMAGPTIDRRPVITMRLVDNMMLFAEGMEMPLEISREMAARMTVGG